MRCMHWLKTNHNFWNTKVNTPLFLVQVDTRSLTRDSLSSLQTDPYLTDSANVYPTTKIMHASYCIIIDVERDFSVNFYVRMIVFHNSHIIQF